MSSSVFTLSLGESDDQPTRPELRGSYGMVASTHWLASASGMAVLERGGNAFDAAVAAGLVLQVVEPHLNGPGGEVPIIFHRAATGETSVVAGQGPSPAAATVAHMRALGIDYLPGNGLLPACVPGAFSAWLRLAAYGELPLADLMDACIGYAEHGHPLLRTTSGAIDAMADLFRTEWTSSAATYLPGGQVPAPGSRFANPALAATYKRVLAEAEAVSSDRDAQLAAAHHAWYEGFVAEAIGEFVAGAEVMDSTGRRHRGLLAGDDLAAFSAPIEAPATFDYGPYTVAKTQPWGQGPVFLQQLALLSGFDLEAMDPAGPEFVHVVTECAKLAFADREAWYGDPAHTDVPLAALLDPAYAAERRALVGETASHELRPGSVDGRSPRLPRLPEDDAAMAAGGGDPTLGVPAAARGPRSGDTCHLDVVDRHGNFVSATPSGAWLQSSPTVPGLGFCLGTRGQMFWVEEGLPSSLAPRKRPRTTLTPSLALRDGEPWMSFGTPGGDQQDQWSLVLFLRMVHNGLDAQQAIDAPAFHNTSFPSSFHPRVTHPGELHTEDRLAPGAVEELTRRGHRVVRAHPWSLGRLSAAGRDPTSGFLFAGANPRGNQGYAAGR
jgi:gamma-glutamyltranspeptidase/glutathione hydrolase